MGILDFEKEVGNRTFQSDNRFKNSLPNGAFEISTQNPDGSKKYSFDTIYKDRELINVARDYYESLNNTEYKDDKDVVDEFIADRTWKQENIAMPGKGIVSEYFDVQSLDNKQKNNRHENVIYCGDYLFHPSIEGAISSGINAGNEIN